MNAKNEDYDPDPSKVNGIFFIQGGNLQLTEVTREKMDVKVK